MKRDVASFFRSMAVCVMACLVITVPASPGQQRVTAPPASHLPPPGSVASDFEMNGIDGQPLKLSSYRGKVILLEFTATWCPPCRQAARDIKQFRSRAATASDLMVISISLDGGENTDTTREDVVRFVREEQIDWPMLFDDTGMENSAARAYAVEVLPAYILIGRDGVIRQTGQGATGFKRIQGTLQKMLNRK